MCDFDHVVAGVLSDAQDRVLIAQRPSGKHHAGLWEFPGGKIEPGETPHAALRRELHEELGIDIGAIDPLIGVPWRYAEKSILLDVYRVLDFAGTPHGREGQALQWCAIDDLADISMPPPDRPVVNALRLPPYYAVTPEPDADTETFLARIDRLLATGVKLIQLRAKTLSPARQTALASAAKALAHAHGARLFVNGHVDVALALGLDGVHLPSADLMNLRERPLPRNRWVAASCHDLRQLTQAVEIGVDFVVLGPVCATASHGGTEPIGWSRFAQLCATVPFPVYALGGLARDDLAAAKAAGAQGVAGISAFFD